MPSVYLIAWVSDDRVSIVAETVLQSFWNLALCPLIRQLFNNLPIKSVIKQIVSHWL